MQKLRTDVDQSFAETSIFHSHFTNSRGNCDGRSFASYRFVASNDNLDDVTDIIIGCAIELHRKFGPGLLHSVYLLLLAQMLLERNLTVEVEKPVPLVAGTVKFDKAFRADLVVNDSVVVEVKSIKKITDVDLAQLLTYLRLMDKRVGLIINFNVAVLRHGIRRVVNRYVNEKGELL